MEPFKESDFTPRKSMVERYNLKGMAESRGLTIKEFKAEVEKEKQLLQKLIDERLVKGYTEEQARNEALRCLYIPGFSGLTFRD
jgi:predicted DNA-binding WGR domain protein